MYPSLLNLFLATTYLYKVFPRSRFFGRERMTWWDFDEVRDVDVVCGCYALVRKQAIDEVGVMDETYFVYGDDPDWCYRFREKGWRVVFTPEARIVHYGGQTTKQMSDRFLLQLMGTKLLFIRMYRGRLEFALSCLVMSLYFLLRVPYWLAHGVLRRAREKRVATPVKTYLLGSAYSLFGWKNLLMNKETLDRRFS